MHGAPLQISDVPTAELVLRPIMRMSDGLFALSRQELEPWISVMPSTDFFVTCPSCGFWPMSASGTPRHWRYPREIHSDAESVGTNRRSVWIRVRELSKSPLRCPHSRATLGRSHAVLVWRRTSRYRKIFSAPETFQDQTRPSPRFGTLSATGRKLDQMARVAHDRKGKLLLGIHEVIE